MKKRLLFIAISIISISCSSVQFNGVNDNAAARAILEGKLEFEDVSGMEVQLANGINNKNYKHQTFLHIAARSGRLEIVKYLVERGADINALDMRKNTALHYATINNFYDIAEYLIKKGADVNAKNVLGMGPLHLAALSLPTVSNNIPSLMPLDGRYTSQFGIRSNPFNKSAFQFHSGVDIAAPQGSIIRAAADGRVMKAGWHKTTGKAIFIRHLHGHVTIYGHCSKHLVKMGALVKKGDPIAIVGKTGRVTGRHLHYTIKLNGYKINPRPYLHDGKAVYKIDKLVRLLINKGAKINSRDYKGRAPIHYAVIRDYQSAKLFVDLGSKVNVRDRLGMTPLHFAATTDIQTTRYLLRKGAFVNARTTAKYTANDGKYYYRGATPLQMAMKYEWLTMAKLLLKYGGKE